ncbi:uncharacterized protein MELLADRAFT_89500 [Melampsora larici-populina 98AG31]|uniref:Uncharacterized protein n=1 Tax=Melampsora larici-populina (strain 98AG31 / pathotype 3-4-7) TaxID=747676 RepID=F4RTK6_MELLP|nr:uncharacterized protein MELLADRAFT_89500 [Melampsora larici-populina 98AG31]EGG04321.1 hypothetical protein MELLADRAFT_89500 [Melampsora larici-populina 98AG31]
MPGNGSKLPPPGSAKPKLKISGSSATDGKSNVNMISAQGEITSPKDPNSSRRPSNTSPSPMGTTSFSAARNVTNIVDITKNPLYEKVQKLDSTLQPFLQHDWETNRKYNLTKLKFYNILHHFNPSTTSRPTHKKDELKSAFKKDLLPKLQPFCSPPPPPADSHMDTDDGLDFDPLHRSTTIAMLASTIHKINPRVNISSVALKDEVLALFKHYVNPNLRLPHNSDYTGRPRIVSSSFVPKLSIQALRHALQSYHPELFLNYSVLRLPNYISLYRLFLLEEVQNTDVSEELVPGYHYWINVDLLDTESTKQRASTKSKSTSHFDFEPTLHLNWCSNTPLDAGFHRSYYDFQIK